MGASLLYRIRRALSRQFSLGGMLAIVNCLFWVGFFTLIRLRPSPAIETLIPLILFFSLPGIPLLVPLPGSGATTPVVVFYCVVIGANALAWGHGLAWLIRWLVRYQAHPAAAGEP